MSKYKFIKQDGKSYTILHPDGEEFVVAKASLEDSDHKAIKGLVGYSEGGEVKEPKEERLPTWDEKLREFVESHPVRRPAGVEGGADQSSDKYKDAYSGPRVKIPVLKFYAGGDVGPSMGLPAPEGPLPPEVVEQFGLNPPVLDVPSNPGQAEEAPVEQVSAVPEAVEPPPEQAGPPEATNVERNEALIGSQEQAETQQAAAAAKAANLQRQQAEEALQLIEAKYSEKTQKVGEASSAVLAGNIDPNNYWNNLGTGNKILSIISVILGGLGSRGGENVGLSLLNKAIEQDIQAQKDTKSITLDILKEKRLAAAGLVDGMLAQAAARTSSVEAKNRAETARLALKVQADELARQQASEEVRREILGSGGYKTGNITRYLDSLSPEEAKNIGSEGIRARTVRFPGGREELAYTAKGAEEVRATMEAIEPIKSVLKRLAALGKAAAVPKTGENKAALSMLASLPPLMNKIALRGGLKDRELDLLKEQVSNPTQVLERMFGTGAGSGAYMETLDTLLDSKLVAHLPNYKGQGKRFGTPR